MQPAHENHDFLSAFRLAICCHCKNFDRIGTWEVYMSYPFLFAVTVCPVCIIFVNFLVPSNNPDHRSYHVVYRTGRGVEGTPGHITYWK